LEPGAPAIIPGKAEMILQFRDADVAVLDRFEAALKDIVAAHQKHGPCKVECVNLSRTMPTVMDERFLDAIAQSAATHAPDKHVRMPSGAGHDARVLGLKLPAAVMLVPSIGGISRPRTRTTDDAEHVLGGQGFGE